MFFYSKELLVEPYFPNYVLQEYTVPGTYTINLKGTGVYEIEAISGGGSGTQWDWYYYWGTTRQFGTKEGSTGAYFKGLVNLAKGTYTIIVGNAGESTSFGDGFTLTGGSPSVAGSESSDAGGYLTVSTYIKESSSNIYNAGYGSIYHYIYQVNPSGIIHGPQYAPVPTALQGYGYGGQGGFYPGTNIGGSGYLKISYKGLI